MDDHVPVLDALGTAANGPFAPGIFFKHAGKSAKDRAEVLAELVRQSKGTMVEALAGQKATKGDKSASIVVIPTVAFHLDHHGSALSLGLQQDATPRLSDINGSPGGRRLIS